MRSSSARPKTQGPITQAWILLANHDSRCHLICTKVQSMPNSCRLHTSASRVAPSNCCFMAFEAWGIDVIGLITPSSTKGHRFILAITDYFSKWAEAIPLVEVKTYNVVNFIKHHVIHRFGVPRRIIHDNSPQFVS